MFMCSSSNLYLSLHRAFYARINNKIQTSQTHMSYENPAVQHIFLITLSINFKTHLYLYALNEFLLSKLHLT